MAYDTLGVDAVTANPLMGFDAMVPFLDYDDRCAFLLCLTSNPGSADFQRLSTPEGPLYQHVARKAAEWSATGPCGLVVGATHPRELATVRSIAPELPILVPGVGAQMGDAGAVIRYGADPNGGGLLVNASKERALRHVRPGLRGRCPASRRGASRRTGTGAGSIANRVIEGLRAGAGVGRANSNAASNPGDTAMERRKLTEEQKQQWAIDGYIVLKGVLSPAETADLRREVDRLHRKHVLNKAGADPKSGLDRRNILPDSDAFIHLMDHPCVFDIFLELMGPYIQLSMAEAVVRPPNPGYKGFIHTDGGQALRHIRVTETSWPLQIKIQYFLTDVRKPERGNFTIFPGSHLRPYPEGEAPITAGTPGAVQLCAAAGDAAVFSHALWHGVSPNLSGRSPENPYLLLQPAVFPDV